MTVVPKTKFTRGSKGGAGRQKAGINYAVHRPDGEGNRANRELFDSKGDITKQEVYARIDKVENRVSDKDPYYYRIVLSHEKTGENVDLKATAREAMQVLEDKHRAMGKEIEWYAVVHKDHSNHEHVHVYITTDAYIDTPTIDAMSREHEAAYERHVYRDEQAVERNKGHEQQLSDKRDAAIITEGQHKGGEAGNTEPPKTERVERKRPRQQIELDWQLSPEAEEQRRRDERYLEGKPSLITSNEAMKEFTQYKQIEATLDPQERRELHLREMEWRREHQNAEEPLKLTDSYYKDNTAFLQDLQDSKHMSMSDRQRYLDSRADERWKERQVIDKGLRGDELVRAHRERYEARKQERASWEPPERRMRWGEARRQYNSQQTQRKEKLDKAWSERPPRNQRQQQRQQQTGRYER